MILEDIEKKQYVDWKVKPVMQIKGKFGFRVVLIMIDKKEFVQQKSGFTTKALANKARNNAIEALTNGTYIVQQHIKTKDYMNYWLNKVIKPRVTNDTFVTYSNSINKYINPNIGKIYLSSVGRKHIVKLYKKIYEVSPSGVRIARTILKTSFTYAISRKLLTENVVNSISSTKEIKTEPYRTINIDSTKTLTLSQIKTLVKASECTKIHIQVILAVLMGLRRGEINGIKYSDIDFINKKLHIQRQLGIKPNTQKEDFDPKTYTKQEIELKTPSSNRELDIPDYVFEEILKERDKYEKNKNRRKGTFQDLNFLCCSTSGRPRSKSYASTHFKALLKEYELPNIRWHDLRKTYCTLLLKNNFSPKAISKLMGHAKEMITVDVYGDNQRIVEDCLEELEPFIEEILPKETEEIFDFSEDDYIYKLELFINEVLSEEIEKYYDFSEDDYIYEFEDYFLV